LGRHLRQRHSNNGVGQNPSSHPLPPLAPVH
jgi:hypothetical protein